MKVLVVDDDPHVREILASVVGSCGHEVTRVDTAVAAWQLLQREAFPLLVLDWMLPGPMDGLELCRRLRAGPHGQAPVILVATGRTGLPELSAILAAGADDYLAKPFDVAGLETRIRIAEAHVVQRARQREMEQLLHDTNEQLQAVLDAVPGTVAWIGADLRYLGVNRQLAAAHGLAAEDFAGQQVGFHMGRAAFVDFVEQVFTSPAAVATRELPIEQGDTPRTYLFMAQKYQGGQAAVFAGLDITERQHAEEALHQSEEQLRQAQKMEAIGQLAGGVAHDFNNLLTAINGFSELALTTMVPTDPCHPYIEEVAKAGERAASLTAQLLAFSRRQVLQPEVLDLNAVVLDMDKLLRRLIREDIDLVLDLDPALGGVRADRGQLGQVLVNLATNARDAMPAGGMLTITTTNLSLDESELVTLGSSEPSISRPGDYVRLDVRDTGVGMDAETQARIFEPFFTTKPKGQGTGLGLSTAYGIVKQSGGEILVASRPGVGTAFSIYLPQVEETVELSISLDDVLPFRGSETVLLAEDEVAVRSLARSVLQANGYTVLEASRGEEALELGYRHEGRIDILVTDLVMPGMNGRELAEQVTRLWPEIRVLFMSGYTDDVLLRNGVLSGTAAFLQKPFSPEKLTRRVRILLDTTVPLGRQGAMRADSVSRGQTENGAGTQRTLRRVAAR